MKLYILATVCTFVAAATAAVIPSTDPLSTLKLSKRSIADKGDASDDSNATAEPKNNFSIGDIFSGVKTIIDKIGKKGGKGIEADPASGDGVGNADPNTDGNADPASTGDGTGDTPAPADGNSDSSPSKTGKKIIDTIGGIFGGKDGGGLGGIFGGKGGRVCGGIFGGKDGGGLGGIFGGKDGGGLGGIFGGV
ncbi:hypothetical protein BDEG_26466 [Batrachochytrium dendrobatidis JEL423]|uniref:Uncharacterized protein n=1 Tax=Batrachochytrium dendrobatidis (strain JEL423) TaxID=403673 RepID=A0A177WUM9_BATDL|nr:hypothetical protein BDEG_26466 [Batrachochytrium dendrobatidis JEL423]